MYAPVIGMELGTIVLLALVLLASGYLLVRTHLQIAPRARLPRRAHAPHEARSTQDSHDVAPHERPACESDLTDLARELMSQFNAKVVALEQRIRTADERIAQLEVLGRKSWGEIEPHFRIAASSNRDASVDFEAADISATQESAVDRPRACASQRPAEFHGSTQAEALSTLSLETPKLSPPRCSVDEARVSRPFVEIYRLADAGVPAAEIARRTASTVGEVELILGLRPKGDGRPIANDER